MCALAAFFLNLLDLSWCLFRPLAIVLLRNRLDRFVSARTISAKSQELRSITVELLRADSRNALELWNRVWRSLRDRSQGGVMKDRERRLAGVLRFGCSPLSQSPFELLRGGAEVGFFRNSLARLF